jgi:NADH-quinone oxidoreductase chain I
MRIYGTGIFKSMLIAYRNMFRKPITVQYPHEKVELPERARWAVAVKHDDNGDIKCTGCLACERACPDYIIEMQMTTAADRSKHIDHYRYEIGACMMCGLCVEACPFDAIEMSHDYELARIDPATLTIDLITDTPAAVAKRKTPPAQPAADAPAAEPPAETHPADMPTAPEGGTDV